MLGLNLRKEFQGERLRGTAIELANENNTGATHRTLIESATGTGRRVPRYHLSSSFRFSLNKTEFRQTAIRNSMGRAFRSGDLAG